MTSTVTIRLIPRLPISQTNEESLLHKVTFIIPYRENFYYVQTFVVFADDPTIAKIKTANILTAQLVLHYAGLCHKNKNCESYFWSLWLHFRKSLHPQKFPLCGTFNALKHLKINQRGQRLTTNQAQDNTFAKCQRSQATASVPNLCMIDLHSTIRNYP